MAALSVMLHGVLIRLDISGLRRVWWGVVKRKNANQRGRGVGVAMSSHSITYLSSLSKGVSQYILALE